MESASFLWNICSHKRIKDGTTETSHVDHLKVRALVCVRPRHRFGRDGRPEAASSSQYHDPAANPCRLAPQPELGELHSFGDDHKSSNVSPQGYDRLKRL